MKVFLCWSGELSHEIALIFEKWLPKVIPNLEPFMSSEDVRKGSIWFAAIKNNLQLAKFGVVFLTKMNIEEPWVYFESGALSVTKEQGNVSPFLYDIEIADVKGPLAQFQCTFWDREDIKRLLKSINVAGGQPLISGESLETNFETNWEALNGELSKLIHGRIAAPKRKAPLELGFSVGSPINLPLPPLKIVPFNVNCHFQNRSETGIVIKKIAAELCTPDGNIRPYRWECFYIYEPDRATQKGITDPMPFAVPANGGIDRGIQFARDDEDRNAEEFAWGVGNYYLNLKVWTNDESLEKACQIFKRLHFQITLQEFATINFICGVSTAMSKSLSEKAGNTVAMPSQLFAVQVRETE